MRASGHEGLGREMRPTAGVGERLSAALGRLRTELARPARNRRVLHRLSVLSDRELTDIGLWRQDVRDAAAADIRDVADFLVARREARRSVCGPRRR